LPGGLLDAVPGTGCPPLPPAAWPPPWPAPPPA
jgi:hypothetical protein